jgi:hypothetical protein
VALNSKGHIFVYSRGGNSNGPAYGNTASQLYEFSKDGKFIREIGKNLYAWSFAHTVRIDKDDNIWAIDKGSDMVIKFNPAGQVVWVFGRKSEASDLGARPLEHPDPPLPAVDGQFRQPTNVTWDPEGNIYISDGHLNSRIANFGKNGKWVKQWGSKGKGPGHFNNSHSIAADAKGRIFIADRNNRRFDDDGNVLKIIEIEVPFDADAVPVIGDKPDLATYRQTGGPFASGAPCNLVHTAAQPVSVCRRRISGTHLQTDPRGRSARRTWRSRKKTQAVRLDPRDGLCVGKRGVRRGAFELARPKARASSRSGQVINAVSGPPGRL